MNRTVKMGAVGVVVVLLVGTGVLAWVTFTQDPGPAFEPSEANSAIHAALIRAGIDAAVVDVTPDRVLVRYEVPDGMDVERSIVIAALQAAGGDPGAGTIVLQVYEDGVPKQQITVETTTVLAFEAGEIGVSELREAMEVQPAT